MDLGYEVAKLLCSEYQRGKTEGRADALREVQPLLDAATEELAWYRKLDDLGDDMVMVMDNWTFAKNALRDAARSYAATKLDAAKAGG